MDILHDLLLAVHFLSIAMGGAAAFGLPVLGAMVQAAPPDHRPSVGRAVPVLKRIGHIGLGLLIVTGAILATTGGAWSAGLIWFWIKLLAVVALIGGIVMGGRLGARAMAGDASAAQQVKTVSMANIGLLAVIVLAASLAFH